MQTLIDHLNGSPLRRQADSYYHVVLSGNRRKVLFSCVDDRRALNVIATDTLQRFDATLHAYCLMSNHFRALVQINPRHIVKALRQIATRYSRHRQRRSKTIPHLFERPYVAQRVDTDGDFLTLLRSIHLTPVIANKVIAPADYLWSSHRAYLGYRSVAKITTDFGLSLFAESAAQGRVAYHQYIEQGIAEDFGRAKKHKAGGRWTLDHQSVNSSPATSHYETLNQPSSKSSAESLSGGIAVVESTSRIQPPSQTKPALLRFGRERRHTASRRFLSIY